MGNKSESNEVEQGNCLMLVLVYLTGDFRIFNKIIPGKT